MRIRSIASFALALAACGHVNTSSDAPLPADAKPVDTAVAVDAQLSFTMNGMWSCTVSIDCEDIYDFDVPAGGSVTAKITAVTNSSATRLALFAGTSTSSTDLFTGDGMAACSISQDTDFSQGPTLVSPGHYRLAVGRDSQNSANQSGTYTITIDVTTGLSNVSQTSDDTASNQGHCPVP